MADEADLPLSIGDALACFEGCREMAYRSRRIDDHFRLSCSRVKMPFSRLGPTDENRMVSKGYQRPTQANTQPARLGSV